MVLISLTTQVLLVILGNRRKYSAGIQVRVIVWSAYLLADSIATMAAGILSIDLGKFDVDGFIDPNVELTAFWVPLMLVHLGGTDAIIAYSLEDNELWRTHTTKKNCFFATAPDAVSKVLLVTANNTVAKRLPFQPILLTFATALRVREIPTQIEQETPKALQSTSEHSTYTFSNL
ncbi:unnamed protein product [Camellia sinensis]